MHTYTSYNPTVLNHIFKHIKAYVFLVPGHLFNTSWKEMLTKQNIEDGICLVVVLFQRYLSLTECGNAVCLYKGMLTQELRNQEYGANRRLPNVSETLQKCQTYIMCLNIAI